MPGMDGFEATRAIRAQERALGLSRVPIIGCTSNESGRRKAACLEAGMDDLLAKPFLSSDLYAMMVRWLDAKLELATPTGSSHSLR